jgi:hypothetical protein
MSEQGYTIREGDAKEIARGIRRVQSFPFREVGPTSQKLILPNRRDHSTIIVKNNTSEDWNAFDIVQIDRSLYTSDEDWSDIGVGKEDGKSIISNACVVFNAKVPTSPFTSEYAVLQTPAKKNSNGMAILLGVTKVRLDDTDEGNMPAP